MRGFAKSWGAAVLCMLLQSYAFAQCNTRTNQVIYVDPKSGVDTGAGTENAPYLTLPHAIWETKYRRTLNCPIQPGKIYIKAGDYVLTSTIYVGGISGTQNAPFIIEGAPGSRFVGGAKITNAVKATSGTIYTRVPAYARSNLYRANLGDYGVTDVGSLQRVAGCSGGGCDPRYLDIYINGAPLSIARYPTLTNGGANDWVPITSVPEVNGNRITYSDTSVGSLVAASGAWAEGFMRAGWMLSRSKVTSVDINSKTLTLDASTLSGGVQQPFPQSRFALMDAPEYLDSAGEYYLSRSENAVYFIPPLGTNMGTAEIMVPTVSRPISIAGDEPTSTLMQNLIFKNISIFGAAERSLNVFYSKNIQIVGGNYIGASEHCIGSANSLNINIYGAHISHCGYSGAYLLGGVLETLTKGNNTIGNSVVEHIGRWRPTSSSVDLLGLGNNVINNTLISNPGSGVSTGVQSFLHLIQGNYIKDSLTWVNDNGGIYIAGKCPHCRKTTVKENIVENIYGYRGTENHPDFSSVGIYADDTVNEVTIENNIVKNVGLGILLGGGQYNTVKKNIITEARNADMLIDERKRANWYSQSVSGGFQIEVDLFNAKQSMYATDIWRAIFPLLSSYDVADPRVLELKVDNNIFGHNKPFAFSDGVGGKIRSVKTNGEVRQQCNAQTPWIDCPNNSLIDGEGRTIKGISPSIDGTYSINTNGPTPPDPDGPWDREYFWLKNSTFSSVPQEPLPGFPYNYRSYIAMNGNRLQTPIEFNSNFTIRGSNLPAQLGIKPLSLDTIGSSNNLPVLLGGSFNIHANETRTLKVLSRTGLTDSTLYGIVAENHPNWIRFDAATNTLRISPPSSAENQRVEATLILKGIFEVERSNISVNVLPERKPAVVSDITYANDGILSWSSIHQFEDGDPAEAQVKYLIRIYDSKTNNLVLEVITEDAALNLANLHLVRGKEYYAKVFTFIREGFESTESVQQRFTLPYYFADKECAYLDFDCDGATDILRVKPKTFSYSIESGALSSSARGVYTGFLPGTLWGVVRGGRSKNMLVAISNNQPRSYDPVGRDNRTLPSAPKNLRGSLPACLVQGKPVALFVQKNGDIYINKKRKFAFRMNQGTAFCTLGNDKTSGLMVKFRNKTTGVFVPDLSKKKVVNMTGIPKNAKHIFFIPKGKNNKEQIAVIEQKRKSQSSIFYLYNGSKLVKKRVMAIGEVAAVFPYQSKIGASGVIIETRDRRIFQVTVNGDVRQLDGLSDSAEAALFLSEKYIAR